FYLSGSFRSDNTAVSGQSDCSRGENAMSRVWIIRGGGLLAALGIAFACARSPSDDGLWDDGGPPPSGTPEGGDSSASALVDSAFLTDANDFPPFILDGNAPPDSITLFGPPTQGAAFGGPCLVEPEADALYPQN